ncbi:hypothetical protein KM043_012153 [Ampulex compressa]|nr:hypothetical protein KM043_012153 [Ampulex compressa]
MRNCHLQREWADERGRGSAAVRPAEGGEKKRGGEEDLGGGSGLLGEGVARLYRLFVLRRDAAISHTPRRPPHRELTHPLALRPSPAAQRHPPPPSATLRLPQPPSATLSHPSPPPSLRRRWKFYESRYLVWRNERGAEPPRAVIFAGLLLSGKRHEVRRGWL